MENITGGCALIRFPASPSVSSEKEEHPPITLADWKDPVFDGPPKKLPPMKVNTEADE